MSDETVIRAWKDASFRERLSDAERALLPAHPAGLIELDDAQLEAAAGARPADGGQHTEGGTCTIGTYVCCCDSIVSCAGCA